MFDDDKGFLAGFSLVAVLVLILNLALLAGGVYIILLLLQSFSVI